MVGLILMIIALVLGFHDVGVAIITGCAGGIFLLVYLGVYVISWLACEIKEIKDMAWDIPLGD